jgi:LPXTG-motif cell wall-anchored protein
VDDNGDDDDNGIIPALGAVAAIAVLAGFGMTRRGKKGKG